MPFYIIVPILRDDSDDTFNPFEDLTEEELIEIAEMLAKERAIEEERDALVNYAIEEFILWLNERRKEGRSMNEKLLSEAFDMTYQPVLEYLNKHSVPTEGLKESIVKATLLYGPTLPGQVEKWADMIEHIRGQVM